MKTFIKTCCLYLAALAAVSCSDDDDKLIVSSETPSVINTPVNGQAFVLTQAQEETNIAITINWDHATYQTPVGVDYTIEMALSETDFLEPTILATTTNNTFSLNVKDFNAILASLGVVPFLESGVDIRIKSTLGDPSQLPQYSNIVSILVTSFTSELPKIAVPGNHQGWNPPEAPLLASSGFGETDYEGYVWLDGGHKFLAPDSAGAFEWGNIDWGDDGSFSGLLLEEGEVDCNASAGYYFIRVDTETLTYSEAQHNWGLIGSATGSWDFDQDMTYNGDGTWSITLDLTAEEIKFRSNDSWDWNYGDTGADGNLNNGGDNIAVPASGNYTVILDLSSPREYTYSLIQN